MTFIVFCDQRLLNLFVAFIEQMNCMDKNMETT